MFRQASPPMTRIRLGLLAWLVAGTLIPTNAASARQAAVPPQQATPAPAPRVFGSPSGLVLNYIKPEKTADFEAVVVKLKEALEKSSNPQRQQQAASWKVYKAADPASGGAVIYIYVVDPAVQGADYTVTTILGEAFSPEESSALKKQYSESYASGQNFVSMTLLSDLGK
jgi:hypothetical protein